MENPEWATGIMMWLSLIVPAISLFVGWRAYIRLRNRLDRLQEEIGVLRQQLSEVEKGSAAQPARQHLTQEETGWKEAASKEMVSGQPEEEPRPQTETSAPEPEPGPISVSPVGSPVPARTVQAEYAGRDWEMRIGGNWLNRIGALALVLGILFFIKYAFDHEWISETTRVILGAVAGAGLIGGGIWSHRKEMPVFGQGLIGAGLAVFYVCSFASFNFYHLVSLEAAFSLMSLVTVLAFLLAVRFRSLAVSLLGLGGGLLTPFLLASGSESTVGLFGYLAFLVLAVLLVLWRQSTWTILYMLTMVSVYMIFFLWLEFGPDTPESLLRSVFLGLFWIMFFVMELRLILRRAKWPAAMTAASGLQAYLLMIGWVRTLGPAHRFLGEVLFLSAAAYLIPLLVRYRLQILSSLPSRELRRLGLTAFLFAVEASGIEWDGFHVVEAWTVLSLVAVWAGKRLSSRWAVVSGASLLGISALVQLLLSDEWVWQMDPPNAFANERGLSALVWTAAAVTAAYLFKRGTEKWDRIWFQSFYTAGAALFWISFTMELNLYFDGLAQKLTPDLKLAFGEHRPFFLFLSWMILSLLAAWTGKRERLRSMLVFSWMLLGISALGTAGWGMAYQPPDGFIPVYNLRFVGLVLTAAFIWIHLRWWKRLDESLRWRGLPVTLVLSLAAVFFELITLEMGDAFAAFGLESRETVRHFGIYMGWLAYSLAVTWLGDRFKIRPLMYIGLGVLGLGVLGTMLDGFLYDVGTGSLPVFNLRFLTLAVAVLAIAVHFFWQRKWGEMPFSGAMPMVLTLTVAVLLFELVTVEVGDWFDRLIQEADQADKKRIGTLLNQKQMSLSIAWLLYSLGLMVTGLMRKNKLLRLTAMGLFGVAILKIFLFDLSFLGMLYRIFSFIGLGVVLLVVSFLYQKNRARFDQTG